MMIKAAIVTRACSKSPGSNYIMVMIGGPGRDRTDDLFHAMEARSQLRHRPTSGKERRPSRRLIHFLAAA